MVLIVRRRPDPGPDRSTPSWAASSPTASSSATRSVLPEPVGPRRTTRTSCSVQRRRVLAAGPQQPGHRGHRGRRRGMLGVARRVRLRPDAFRGREALYTLFTLGLLFPSAVAILPLFILVRDLGPVGQPARASRCPQAAFGLPLTIDHPAAVLPEHPGRARGRRAGSTAAARSGSSGGCCCRWRGRRSPRSACWRSSPRGTPSCCR